MSAKGAIRLFCRWCTLNSYKEVRECPVEDCPIWPFREGDTIKGTSKIKAVRKKCEDCVQTKHTGKCKQKNCPLYPYREGHRPVSDDHVKKVLSPEQLAKLHAHLPPKRVKHEQKGEVTKVPIVTRQRRRMIGHTKNNN